MSSTTPQSDYRKPSITLRCSLRNSRIAAILPGGACEALRYDDNECARLLTCSKSVLHQTHKEGLKMRIADVSNGDRVAPSNDIGIIDSPGLYGGEPPTLNYLTDGLAQCLLHKNDMKAPLV